jgi:Leucine-rich repeat (LRR) protein
MQDTLLELRLAHNLLGDALNPIFSTIEFQSLTNLKVLDISYNKIRGVERGLLKGCTKLQVFIHN